MREKPEAVCDTKKILNSTYQDTISIFQSVELKGAVRVFSLTRCERALKICRSALWWNTHLDHYSQYVIEIQHY